MNTHSTSDAAAAAAADVAEVNALCAHEPQRRGTSNVCLCRQVCYIECAVCRTVCRREAAPALFVADDAYALACTRCTATFCVHCYNTTVTDSLCVNCVEDNMPRLWMINYHLTVEDDNRRRFPQVFHHPTLFADLRRALDDGAAYVNTLFVTTHSLVAIRELVRTLKIQILNKDSGGQLARRCVVELDTRYSSQPGGSLHLLMVVKSILPSGTPIKAF